LIGSSLILGIGSTITTKLLNIQQCERSVSGSTKDVAHALWAGKFRDYASNLALCRNQMAHQRDFAYSAIS
jgi:hypothetical protein